MSNSNPLSIYLLSIASNSTYNNTNPQAQADLRNGFVKVEGIDAKTINDGASLGFSGQAWVNLQTGQVVIANRGTDLGGPGTTGLNNLRSDADLGLGQVNFAQDAANKYADAAIRAAKKQLGSVSLGEIYLTGHSLGGGEAGGELVALAPRYSNNHFTVATFDAPGLGGIKTNGLNSKQFTSANYSARGDVVSKTGGSHLPGTLDVRIAVGPPMIATGGAIVGGAALGPDGLPLLGGGLVQALGPAHSLDNIQKYFGSNPIGNTIAGQQSANPNQGSTPQINPGSGWTFNSDGTTYSVDQNGNATQVGIPFTSDSGGSNNQGNGSQGISPSQPDNNGSINSDGGQLTFTPSRGDGGGWTAALGGNSSPGYTFSGTDSAGNTYTDTFTPGGSNGDYTNTVTGTDSSGNTYTHSVSETFDSNGNMTGYRQVDSTRYNPGPLNGGNNLGLGNDGLGQVNDGLGQVNDGQGLDNDGLGLDNDGQGLDNDGLGLDNDGLGLDNDGLGLDNDGLGLRAFCFRFSRDLRSG